MPFNRMCLIWMSSNQPKASKSDTYNGKPVKVHLQKSKVWKLISHVFCCSQSLLHRHVCHIHVSLLLYFAERCLPHVKTRTWKDVSAGTCSLDQRMCDTHKALSKRELNLWRAWQDVQNMNGGSSIHWKGRLKTNKLNNSKLKRLNLEIFLMHKRTKIIESVLNMSWYQPDPFNSTPTHFCLVW